ncbi:MAG: Predicted RNA binding protein YcfA, dsRBD-like fold, HicA-like mRNA interferase family [Candidatus Kentron sp. G]|nr:MAG: Predicted RNA binding protein YcfA, dsRBD-like fold, HicA-like mRNA interferase family [Candidatus Kentron sp. G]VFM99907.1 MAG: Predicted RNA binding protein YcfA, dsRBD-like fold, HicA-like mRNA interferase family [Candidatus Kentron sp. G]VFN01570.1 MAG: Predicted RNA binding protein YcfA, dsRBD-like fold, HicA-like mRNA interferase family [Candidatus Kentron sp. G]
MHSISIEYYHLAPFSRLGVLAAENTVKFNELVRLLEKNGFRVIKEKGSIRYYGKEGSENIVRVDYHGAREVPKGTCRAILKAARIQQK